MLWGQDKVTAADVIEGLREAHERLKAAKQPLDPTPKPKGGRKPRRPPERPDQLMIDV